MKVHEPIALLTVPARDLKTRLTVQAGPAYPCWRPACLERVPLFAPSRDFSPATPAAGVAGIYYPSSPAVLIWPTKPKQVEEKHEDFGEGLEMQYLLF